MEGEDKVGGGEGPLPYTPFDNRSWWDRTFGKKEIVRWPITPGSLFVSVITAVAVGAALIIAGGQIGAQRDMQPRTSLASPRTESPQLKALTKQVEMLTRLLLKQPAPVKVEVVMPKDSIKIALPPAPKPQAIHIHTKEIRTLETERVVEKVAPTPVKTKVRASELPEKEATTVEDDAGEELPPPVGTEQRRIWDAKQAAKGVKDGTVAGGKQTP